MVEIKAKLKVRRSAYPIEVKGRLELAFELRRKGRFPAKLASGEEVEVALPSGEPLRGGDLVTASDGRIIEVVALPEPLLQVQADARELARAAYHLGNGHVPVELGEGWLRVAEDHALEQRLRELGFKASRISAPFEPELVGAHGAHEPAAAGDEAPGHHHHDHDHGHHHGHGHKH